MKKRILYLWARIRYFIAGRNYEILNDYYRKQGIKIGERCLICSNLVTYEPYLIEIKDNVVISTEVSFITHDFSVSRLVGQWGINLYGKIVVGNNNFIGKGSILMYGIELADNIIVAAGSVVTKSFSQNNIIIGGNPARVIGTWDDFIEKNKEKLISDFDIRRIAETNPERLVRRGINK